MTGIHIEQPIDFLVYRVEAPHFVAGCLVTMGNTHIVAHAAPILQSFIGSYLEDLVRQCSVAGWKLEEVRVSP